MFDKRMTVDAIVDQLCDGMTIAIGGWATRRKPMALVRAIARSNLKDLTVIAYGGPDVGILAACGKLRLLVFAFVSMDQIPIEPHFRAARQAGLEVWEMDEGMLHWGLRAAAMGLPFLPTRVGIGTAIADDPRFKTVTSPYGDGETLIAMPAIKPDVALLHVHRSDEKGNVLTLSPDPFFDELMARAAEQTFVTTEQVVSTAELDLPANARFHLVERALIAGVAEVPFGAHPTSAAPDYHLDLAHLRSYAAAEGEAWDAYRARYIGVDAPSYLAAVGGADAIRAIPAPNY
ncbi:CoA transferase subunit A [Sphingomonas hengshuiensis]|uniref:CoA-transferase n=1 Tax=Sphingomonas hengshuiensis TaxID=1609977 RepID=A0A7U4LEH7_9SPHN|nr:CoA-transferase [Sphingomonas hengshuiensis]AJP71218.1 CoA-transferase [Sphingomonas hengshuiensis]